MCTQPVLEHPPELATPALDALQEKLEKARRAETDARSRLDQARTVAAAAGEAVAAARTGVDQNTERQQTAEANLARACQALNERVHDRLTISAGEPIDQQVQAAYRLAAGQKQSHENARDVRARAGRIVHERERAADRLSDSVSRLADQLGQHEARIADLTRQITEIDEDVRQVTQAAEPGAERDSLILRRENLQEALNESRRADADAGAKLSSAAARLDAAEGAYKIAQEDARRGAESARAAAIEAGFPDEVAAAEAEIRAAELQEMSSRIDAYQAERRTTEARIGELVDELRGAEVTEAMLDAAEAEATGVEKTLQTARDERARLDEQIRALTDAIKRADALREEVRVQRAKHAVYHGLALDLRSDRFQAFLLQETFRELVAGASARLWDLTKRYRFDWQNEAFQIVDHDNARQTRSADTLSGGETFLASLALALQLSEQVQSAAGATMLDSLFIDEGFGTLDPEALDAAASAIESLQVGGRMVGIITHIDELSLRLPARVRVNKTPDGSRLTVESS